jgi:uncharacterized repeat protein (TIGR03803 family)
MTNLARRRGWSSRTSLRAASVALALVVVLVQILVTTAAAEAQPDVTFTLLYSFKGGTDGDAPVAGLLRDASGNLYGTTFYGGTSDHGTVFKLDAAGTETVLYRFTGGADGGNPQAGLIRDAAGNLYGTTLYGGIPSCQCGTVFKLDTTGTEIVLHSFNFDGVDGIAPQAGLVRDAAGNFYGTTSLGGAVDNGTVFKLDTTGAETILHSFAGGIDGDSPHAGLIRDAAGNLYGTTPAGGDPGSGTVFKLDSTGAKTVLHNFFDHPDGKSPWAGLVGDAAGELYGTTQYGGTYGKGTVFKLDKAGRGKVLYSFSGPDGSSPSAGLILDRSGNLYGTTYAGGASDMGIVFKLDTVGNLTLLHAFHGGRGDGMNTGAGLVRDAAGNLYGTTPRGGAFNKGTVFKLTP